MGSRTHPPQWQTMDPSDSQKRTGEISAPAPLGMLTGLLCMPIGTGHKNPSYWAFHTHRLFGSGTKDTHQCDAQRPWRKLFISCPPHYSCSSFSAVIHGGCFGNEAGHWRNECLSIPTDLFSYVKCYIQILFSGYRYQISHQNFEQGNRPSCIEGADIWNTYSNESLGLGFNTAFERMGWVQCCLLKKHWQILSL